MKTSSNPPKGFPAEFSSEANCRKYFFDLRWPRGFICPRCGCKEKWDMKNGRFLCRPMRHQVSSTSGTIFSDSHKPLRDWFRALWILTGTATDINAVTFRRDLGLGSYRTAWRWMREMRKVMRPSLDLLSGTVAVDEVYLPLAAGSAGRALIMIAAEIESPVIKKIRLQVLATDKSDSIVTAVKSMVKVGATVQTDALVAYSRLPLCGYVRSLVGPAATAILGEGTLPQLQPVVSELKDWLRKTHNSGMHYKNLQCYLDEFAFRFNNRPIRSHRRRFEHLLERAIRYKPVSISDDRR